MKKGLKIGIIATIVFGAAAYILGRIGNIKNLVTNLVVTPKWYGSLNDMKIDVNKGIKCPLAIDIENRTDTSLDIKINSVDLYGDGKQIATSAAGNYSKTLRANSTVTIPIDVWISSSVVYSMLGTSILSLISGDTDNIKSKAQQLIKDATLKINLTAKGVMMEVSMKLGESKTLKDEKKGTSGLGLVNYSKREIKPLADYIEIIPDVSELKHEDAIIIDDVTPEETAEFIREVGRKYKKDTEVLASVLRGRNNRETVENIWKFCVSHIRYTEDSKENEEVRRPLRTLYEQKADCDCFSALIASICENLGIPYIVRIAEYDNKGYFQHVYVIADGYVCDPVVDQCFYEKETSNHKDY